VPSNKSKPKPKPREAVLNFEAIGTEWSIELRTNVDNLDEIIAAVTARISRFDADYSRFRSDSLVAKMAHAAGTYGLPDDAKPMLDLYYELYKHTQGAMTPLIGQVLVDAGYDAKYSLRSKELHEPPDWEEVLTYDFSSLTLKRPALLDFGAIGKGYLVDIVGGVLTARGIDRFLINAGGDILHHDISEPVEIALEHPGNVTQAIGLAKLNNQSICGSAGNRRKWEGYHHVINPKTLSSPTNIAAIWVCADTAMLADALSTALFFVDPANLRKQYSFEYAIVYDDYALNVSKGFPATFFTK
jgi:thiamine biosynthesis lipoprotein